MRPLDARFDLYLFHCFSHSSLQLKDKLGREAEEALERERVAAAGRSRELSERYEQQLQVRRPQWPIRAVRQAPYDRRRTACA